MEARRSERIVKNGTKTAPETKTGARLELLEVSLNGEPGKAVGATCDSCGRSATELFSTSDTRWGKGEVEGVFCSACAPVRVNRPRLKRSFGLALDELRKAVNRHDGPRGNMARTRLVKLFLKARDAGLVDGDPEELTRETASELLRQRQAGTQRKRGPSSSGRAWKRDRARLLQAMGLAEADAYNAALAHGKGATYLAERALEPGDTEQAFKSRAKRRRKSHPKHAGRHERLLREFMWPVPRAAGPPPPSAKGTKAPLKRV